MCQKKTFLFFPLYWWLIGQIMVVFHCSSWFGLFGYLWNWHVAMQKKASLKQKTTGLPTPSLRDYVNFSVWLCRSYFEEKQRLVHSWCNEEAKFQNRATLDDYVKKLVIYWSLILLILYIVSRYGPHFIWIFLHYVPSCISTKSRFTERVWSWLTHHASRCFDP